MANKAEQTITVGVARLSYANLFKPVARNPQDDPKYSTTILIPKNDVRSKQLMDMAIEAAKQTGLMDQFQGAIPPILATPVYDGDGVRPSDGLPFGAECKGHWVFTASAQATNPPGVVDKSRNKITDHSEVYSGIYALASINFYAYHASGKKGIGIGINNVMKISDGPSLAGKKSANEDFSDIDVSGFEEVEIDPITGEPVL